MPSTIKLAEYLFQRLRQLGIGSVHGVPGDFNLTLLDFVEPSGLRWVGNANELNAGYAADGYARINGLGALVTTFGVGELSAINAIAGAYAERAAVVHIVGTPGRDLQDSRTLVHHTFNDGNFRRFSMMCAHVTVAQADLRDPRRCPAQIDEALMMCLLHGRPVYIEVPVDMVDVYVSAERLELDITLPVTVRTASQDVAIAQVLERIHGAKQPLILIDGEVRANRVIDQVQNLVKTLGWPTWTHNYARGLLDETLENVHGVYRGKYCDPKTKKFFDGADLILCFSPHFSTTNTWNGSSIPKSDVSVLFTDTEIKMGGETFRDIPIREVLSQLLEKTDLARVKAYEPYPDLPSGYKVSFSDVPRDGKVTQDNFYRVVSNYIRPGDIVLGETGSPGYGSSDMVLPQHARLFTPVTWPSIGYMLPATQGAALAQRELMDSGAWHGIQDARTILMIGDGSFQMTVQELATMIRLNLDVIVILVNNDGYSIERFIHGFNQAYNDVGRWRYLQAPSLFGAGEDTYTKQVKTWGELEEALEGKEIKDGKGLRMVEVLMDRDDFPVGPITDLLAKQKLNDKEKNEANGSK